MSELHQVQHDTGQFGSITESAPFSIRSGLQEAGLSDVDFDAFGPGFESYIQRILTPRDTYTSTSVVSTFIASIGIPEQYKHRVEPLVTMLAPHVFEIYHGDHTGHDIDHAATVLKHTLKLYKTEYTADLDVAVVNALMHDTHRGIGNIAHKSVSGEKSVPVVRYLLRQLWKSRAVGSESEAVTDSIGMHDETNFDSSRLYMLKDPFAAMLLRDADVLEGYDIDRLVKWCTYYKDDIYHTPDVYESGVIYTRKANNSMTGYAKNILLQTRKTMHTREGRLTAQRMHMELENFIDTVHIAVDHGIFTDPKDYQGLLVMTQPEVQSLLLSGKIEEVQSIFAISRRSSESQWY